MNIDERVYGYEPAASQLKELRSGIERLRLTVNGYRNDVDQEVNANEVTMTTLFERDAEIKRLHTAYEQERQDCINLTEKVIPGLRDEIKRLREELNRTRNAVDIVADAKNTEIEQLRKDFTDLLRLAANDASEHQAKIERLREGWAETNSTLLSRNIEIVGLKDENERLRGELAEKDDYIKTVSRPIGAHSYE